MKLRKRLRRSLPLNPPSTSDEESRLRHDFGSAAHARGASAFDHLIRPDTRTLRGVVHSVMSFCGRRVTQTTLNVGMRMCSVCIRGARKYIRKNREPWEPKPKGAHA